MVVHDGDRDLTEPGNTCMISIPSVWDPKLAPPGHLLTLSGLKTLRFLSRLPR